MKLCIGKYIQAIEILKSSCWKLWAEYLAEAWYLHPNPIKPMLFRCSKSLFTESFRLRCVQPL